MSEATGLSKFYREFAAIRDVTFQIPAGQVAAFLGPNGAGKSTTMKILTAYVSPSAGTARIAGIDVVNDRIHAAERLTRLPAGKWSSASRDDPARIASVLRARPLYGWQTAELTNRASHPTVQPAVGHRKSIRKLSRGYRQRVGMAQVLLHEADVLIMDEPTNGLDPNQIHDMRRTIRDITVNRTILLSTHILQEVQAVADRVLLISRGRLIFDGTRSRCEVLMPAWMKPSRL